MKRFCLLVCRYDVLWSSHQKGCKKAAGKALGWPVRKAVFRKAVSCASCQLLLDIFESKTDALSFVSRYLDNPGSYHGVHM